MKASVIIPALDGGRPLARCVEACLGQIAPWPFEVLVIDSGSADGGPEWIASRAAADPRLRLHRIPKSEYGHGHTRNLGASLTTGDFICYLTQDALPADSLWLRTLVETLEAHPRAAGAFGRHRAHPHHPLPVARAIDDLFASYGATPSLLSVESPSRYANDIRYRSHLHFFSDNNSCLRRSAWSRHPFPEVDFGEDQLWADCILRSGESTLYIPDAVVFHSHDYSAREAFLRARQESFFFQRYFGYRLRHSRWHALNGALKLTRDEARILLPQAGRLGLLRRLPGTFVRHFAVTWGHYLGGRDTPP